MKNSVIFSKSEKFMSNETFAQAFRRANKELRTLSQVIKSCKDVTVWAELSYILPSLNIDGKSDLTPQKVISLARKVGLTKQDKKGETLVCKVVKKVESETVTATLADGTTTTVKRNKLDKNGKEIVTYELRKIGTWTLRTLIEILVQAHFAGEQNK